MNKGTRVLKTLAFVALLAPVAMIGCKGRGHGMNPQKIEKMEKRIASKLDLNDLQKSKLSEVTAELKKVMAEKKNDRGQDVEFAKSQIKADKLNIAEVKEFFLSKQENHVAVFDRVAPKLEAFHASLNAEQKNKMVEFLDKMKERFPSKE